MLRRLRETQSSATKACVPHDILHTLQEDQYFSSLDLRSGYSQIPLYEAAKPKAAFVTPDGIYEFNVMPLGSVTLLSRLSV